MNLNQTAELKAAKAQLRQAKCMIDEAIKKLELWKICSAIDNIEMADLKIKGAKVHMDNFCGNDDYPFN